MAPRLIGSQQPEERTTVETELGVLDQHVGGCIERSVEIREVLGIEEERTEEKAEAVEPQVVDGVVGKRIAYVKRLQSDAKRVRSNLDAILEIAKHI